MASASQKSPATIEELEPMYVGQKMSIHQIHLATGYALSTIRARLRDGGVLRSLAEGVRLAAANGTYSKVRLGKKKPPFSDQHKARMSAARNKWAEENAVGIRIKSTGYEEYTRGEHKGRGVHVVLMEQIIGRRLERGECVHHIDGDKRHNELSNLRLMTTAAHVQLHRLEEIAAGNLRERNRYGQFE